MPGGKGSNFFFSAANANGFPNAPATAAVPASLMKLRRGNDELAGFVVFILRFVVRLMTEAKLA